MEGRSIVNRAAWRELPHERHKPRVWLVFGMTDRLPPRPRKARQEAPTRLRQITRQLGKTHVTTGCEGRLSAKVFFMTGGNAACALAMADVAGFTIPACKSLRAGGFESRGGWNPTAPGVSGQLTRPVLRRL